MTLNDFEPAVNMLDAGKSFSSNSPLKSLTQTPGSTLRTEVFLDLTIRGHRIVSDQRLWEELYIKTKERIHLAAGVSLTRDDKDTDKAYRKEASSKIGVMINTMLQYERPAEEVVNFLYDKAQDLYIGQEELETFTVLINNISMALTSEEV